jgi:ketosteroid isomerase-like protein
MKGKLISVAAFSLVGLLQGCGGSGGDGSPDGQDLRDQWEAELMRADEVFAETVGSEGLPEWGSFFSAEGAVIQEGAGEIRGVEAIQASADAAAGAITSFSWSPERAEVSEGGDLGYTVGTFRTTAMRPDSVEMVTTGMYVSIWRRQADGSWKVEMDLGNPIMGPQPLDPEGTGGGNP